MNAVTETTAAEPVSGVEIFVPLAKLKKSPRNARKVPHGEAAIEALAASIQHKGLIQNLVVEPEIKDGEPTGCYFVTAGEGRRLAMLLRAKRKQIKKSEPVRCWLDTANDPAEVSLDENVTRTPMHPADQFERFAELSRDKGWGAEEIGARFGVTASVVKQRLRLGAVSPKLLQVYREDGLTLDQLMAFAITEDHARQEQVFEGLHHNREPWIIRRDMTAANVPAHDRRAVFVGADAYVEAGGTIIRDLFSEDRGGFFEDVGLLDMLAIEKLREIAGTTQAEGWKWAEAHIDYRRGRRRWRVGGRRAPDRGHEEGGYGPSRRAASCGDQMVACDHADPRAGGGAVCTRRGRGCRDRGAAVRSGPRHRSGGWRSVLCRRRRIERHGPGPRERSRPFFPDNRNRGLSRPFGIAARRAQPGSRVNP